MLGIESKWRCLGMSRYQRGWTAHVKGSRKSDGEEGKDVESWGVRRATS